MFALAFLSLFLLFILTKIYKNGAYNSKICNLPPSPPTLPFIGNLHQVGSLSHNSLLSLSRKYGPLMFLWLGRVPTLIISSSEMAEEIMKHQDDIFASRPSTKASKLLLYGNKNLGFAPYGEYWKFAKRLYLVHLLGAAKVLSFDQERKKEVLLALENIRNAKESSSMIDLSEVFSSFTLDIICRVVAKDFPKKHLLRELVEEGTSLFEEFNFEDFFPSLQYLDIFLKFDSKSKNIFKKWNDLLEELIEDHLNSHQNGESKEKIYFINVLLSLWRQESEQEDFKLTKEHVKGVLMDMFAAGSHTTFITLEWAMAETLKDIKIMEKLKQEIQQIPKGREIITNEDLKDMIYLKCVIKETLRLHTPAPLLVPRESMQESRIKGYTIPKGTKVLINAWAINRDSDSWKNPEKFIPERFMENNVDFKGNHFQFIPFGAGRRICPGINFAISNIEILMANILYHFDWELPFGLTRQEFDMNDASGLSARRNSKLYLVPK